MPSVLHLQAVGLQLVRSAYFLQPVHEALWHQLVLASLYEQYGRFDFGYSFGRVEAAVSYHPH